MKEAIDMPTLEIEDFRARKRDMRAQLNQISEGVEALVREYSLKIVRRMKVLVPVDTGDLRDSIRRDLTVTANRVVAKISAGRGLDDPRVAGWVEWGTGTEVDIPRGLEAYARKWYVSGLGKLPAQPYFFPAVEEYRREFFDDLRTLIRTGKKP
jgi:hypothetical protein